MKSTILALLLLPTNAVNLRTRQTIDEESTSLIDALAKKYNCASGAVSVEQILKQVKVANAEAKTDMDTTCANALSELLAIEDAAKAASAKKREEAPGIRQAAFEVLEKEYEGVHAKVVKLHADKVSAAVTTEAEASGVKATKQTTNDAKKSAYQTVKLTVEIETEEWTNGVEGYVAKKAKYASDLETAKGEALAAKKLLDASGKQKKIDDFATCATALAERVLTIDADAKLIEEITPMLNKIAACKGQFDGPADSETSASLLEVDLATQTKCAIHQRRVNSLLATSNLLEINPTTGSISDWQGRITDERADSKSVGKKCNSDAMSVLDRTKNRAQKNYEVAIKEAETAETGLMTTLDARDVKDRAAFALRLKNAKDPFDTAALELNEATATWDDAVIALAAERDLETDETKISSDDMKDDIKDADDARKRDLTQDKKEADDSEKLAIETHASDKEAKDKQCEFEIKILTEEAEKVDEIMGKIDELMSIRDDKTAEHLASEKEEQATFGPGKKVPKTGECNSASCKLEGDCCCGYCSNSCWNFGGADKATGITSADTLKECGACSADKGAKCYPSAPGYKSEQSEDDDQDDEIGEDEGPPDPSSLHSTKN